MKDTISRRRCTWYNANSHFCQTMYLIPLVILLTTSVVKAQESLEIIRGESNTNRWIHYSDASNALYHHITGQAYGLLDRRAEKISKLHTLSGWQDRQDEIRSKLTEIIGPFPEKTPLNAEVVRTVEKDTYRVEHIIYESQPDFYVTSSLFIPEGLKGQGPAVIYTSGHTPESYRSTTYQHVILNLVRKGFIVFAFDPVGQGERLEYFQPQEGTSAVGGPTREHSYPGAQGFITGSSQARYMIWDGIRAVDYLLTRDEIDPARIGITGRSGGGTQSAYIAAFDERIHAAAPENYITSLTRLLESIGPQDAEQNLPGGIARGIDHGDLLAVRAPKPALMLTTTGDFFSIQGARETAREVAEIYKAYSKEGNFSMVEDDASHASTQKNREAMYGFFQQHLDNPGSVADLPTEPLSEEEIRVTRTGQVSTSLEGETVFSLNRREAEGLMDKLQASRQEDLSGHLSEVLASARELSGYREPVEVAQPVFAGRNPRGKYAIEKYFVKGEGDYVIPYLLLVPDEPNGKALIYLHPSGKDAEASKGGELEWFVRNGFTVLSPDIIGVGEMGPGDLSRVTIEGVSYSMWFASVLIGRSIVGIRAGDVVRLIRLLERDTETDEIYGVARREMTPVLLHAAAFDDGISRIALVEPYSSYRSIVTNRFYEPDFVHGTVAGSLKAYDLPDLAASLAPRKLIMAGVTDGFGKTIDTALNIMEDLSFIKTAYKERKADGQLNIISRKSLEKPNDLFIEWIKE